MPEGLAGKTFAEAMETTSLNHYGVRTFGPFTFDPDGGELSRDGYRVRLQPQPALVLAILTDQPGKLVPREEIYRAIWGDDTHVDFEQSLNYCIRQIRAALRDDAADPKYLETVPKRGYRFLASVEISNGNGSHSGTHVVLTPENGAATLPEEAGLQARRPGRWKFLLLPGVTLALLAVLAVVWMNHRRQALPLRGSDTVLIADFENQTGDPRFDDALLTAFTVSIGQSRFVNVFPRSRIESVLKRMGRSGSERTTVPLAREICTRENIRGLIANTITRTGQQFELTAELIDPGTGATVRSYKERSYGEDHILEALDSIASRVRADLGESLQEIQKADQPLPLVTTSSLTALKEYAEASSLWKHTKYDDAVALYKAAIEIDPNFAMAHAALGRAYASYIYYQTDLGRKEYDAALALPSRLTERERMVIQTHEAIDLDHVDDADRFCRSYLATYPEDWSMLRDYASLLRRHGRHTEAIEQHKRILAIAPDDAHTWIEMATAYKSLGNFFAAVQAYAHAFQIEPSWLVSGNINREYGMALVGNGEEQKAVSVFSDLLEKSDKRADGLRSVAMLDLFHGRYTAAQGRFQEALQVDENNHNSFGVARTHFFLAVVAEGRGDTRMRLAQLDAAVADLKSMGPRVEWGSIVGQEYIRAGALAKAEKLAEFIAPLTDAHDSEQQGYVHLLQGAIAAEKGDTDKSVAELSTLTDPKYGPSVNGLALAAVADAYQRAGNRDQAIVWHEKLSAPLGLLAFWEPQQRWAYARYQLALDYQERGQNEKARQTLATLLDLWKDADANLPLRNAALQLQARLPQ
ncbi:MAG: winged helix-turn-helix domain-containing protein [Terriglobales bacterium]|jgi:DNA-binding winged helix-turn-helix (wHTH) protein/tetratricopeptide (TPR) repeat protein